MKIILISLCGIILSLGVVAKESNIAKHDPKLHFLENKGQVKDQNNQSRTDIDFSLSASGVNVFIGAGAVHYQFTKVESVGAPSSFIKKMIGQEELPELKTSIYRLDMELVGASKTAVAIPEHKQAFVHRYYDIEHTEGSGQMYANSLSEAFSYDKVTYRNIYPDIDWVIYIKNSRLEYDFVVRPGGDPKNIKLKYTGATQLNHNIDGSLTAMTPMGSVEEYKPYSFQSDGKEVASSFKVDGATVSFNVGAYDGTLTIDPSVVWSSFFGGPTWDEYTCISTDAQGNIYAGGATNSISNIATNGTTYQGVNGVYCGFLSKFSIDGNLLWASYWIGTEGRIRSVTTDGQDTVYIAGRLGSAVVADACVAKFTPTGTYVNGVTWGEYGIFEESVEVACYGNSVYIAGHTLSNSGVPIINAWQPANAGYRDDFILKMDEGWNVIWGTYYGGEGDDFLNDMKIDHIGNVYVAGRTLSDVELVTVGPVIYNTTGQNSLYVAKFSSTGQRKWGLMCGTQSEEYGGDLAVDTIGEGAVYLNGFGTATGIATPGAYAEQPIGGDGFLVKYDTAGTVIWGTYTGGSGDEAADDITIDKTGVYLAGATNLNGLDTANAFQTVFGGDYTDGAIWKFSKDGDFIWASYFGGAQQDAIGGVAVNTGGDICIAGHTEGGNFLVNPTYQSVYGGGYLDGFVARIRGCMQLPNWAINGDTALCMGGSATYVVPASGWVTEPYVWSLTGGISGNSLSDTISIQANGAGNATIMVSANNTCDTVSELIDIIVYSLPVPVITNSGNQLGTGSYVSYQWNWNGTPIPGATGQGHIATDEGDYTVTVTDANGCTGTSDVSPVGISITEKGKGTIVLAPNPNKGEFILAGAIVSSDGKIVVRVLDVIGRTVYEKQEHSKNGLIRTAIDLDQNAPAGIYFVKLISDSNAQTIQFSINE